MALILADRVQETTNTTGTGTLTLAGAVSGFQSFGAIGNGNTTYYTIVSGTDWEVGLGTYTAAGTTLSRDTVLSSSSGGTAISVVAGASVFCDYPAGKAILGTTSATASTGTGSVVLSDSPTFTTAITSTGALQLTGSDTVNQNIATSQTSGSLTIGGTGATGTMNIGRSTATNTINISNGNNPSGTTKTINLATGSTAGTTTVNIAPVGTATGTTNVNIATQVRTSGATTVNIAHNGQSGSTTTIRIGGTFSTTNLNGTINFSSNSIFSTSFNQTTTTQGSLPTGIPVGARAFITDALSPIFGQIATGGGAVPVPVYFDGTNWRVG